MQKVIDKTGTKAAAMCHMYVMCATLCLTQHAHIACDSSSWAARYNAWLLSNLILKGVVFSFLFSPFHVTAADLQTRVDFQKVKLGSVIVYQELYCASRPIFGGSP